MAFDNDYSIDLAELQRQVESADVVCIFFPLLRQTLVLDNRSSDVDEPMVRLAPMVANSQERLEWLESVRPRFGRPETMVLTPWPKSVSMFRDSGVLEMVTAHFESVGAPAAARNTESAFAELAGDERKDLRSAIVGDNYRTMWSRT
ncbi:MAG: hypothetical protein ACSLFM_03645 [Tepidiformaceae bacterium]